MFTALLILAIAVTVVVLLNVVAYLSQRNQMDRQL